MPLRVREAHHEAIVKDGLRVRKEKDETLIDFPACEARRDHVRARDARLLGAAPSRAASLVVQTEGGAVEGNVALGVENFLDIP
jgi:hypothetical protein